MALAHVATARDFLFRPLFIGPGEVLEACPADRASCSGPGEIEAKWITTETSD